MGGRHPRRLILPVVAATLIGGALAGLSQAQPQSPTGPPLAQPLPAQPGAPPGSPDSIDQILTPGGAPAEEAPPPPAAVDGAAPAASKTVVDVDEEKEKPAATTPLPEKAPAPPARVRRAEAIIQALDKVTAVSIRFPAAIGKPVRWKDLVFTVHACEEPGPDDTDRGAFAHMEVYSEPRVGPGRTPPPPKEVYRGWMFAEAPAVHPFEHPVYDVWLIACRTA